MHAITNFITLSVVFKCKGTQKPKLDLPESVRVEEKVPELSGWLVR